MIQDQVRLPWRVAVGVVLQGIRIRFGRSVVTVVGVVLGLAFLMSTLTGQAIKEAVSGEDELRAEVKRMASFLGAEMGPAEGRVVGVVQTGPLDEAETRLIGQLVDGGLSALQWYSATGESATGGTPVPRFGKMEAQSVALESVGQGASSVLVVGGGPVPEAVMKPGALLAGASEKVLAFTRPQVQMPEAAGVSVVGLARERTPEEVVQRDEERRNARFRSNWIVAISLVVTVAGIANAMLMSVTERFREIGTMKCLGALSSFVRWMFFVESSLMGAVGGAVGGILGAAFSLALYGFTYGYGLVLGSVDFARLGVYLVLSVLAGVGLSVIAAIYPASVASGMVPAHALRTNV